MPPEAIGKHARYNASLDIFSFGHLTLFTLTQMWSQLKGATYTDPHTKKIIAYSEIERREDVFDCLYCQLERKHAFVSLIQDCLQNCPTDRPSAADLVNRIKKIPLKSESISKINLIRQLSNIEERLDKKLTDAQGLLQNVRLLAWH